MVAKGGAGFRAGAALGAASASGNKKLIIAISSIVGFMVLLSILAVVIKCCLLRPRPTRQRQWPGYQMGNMDNVTARQGANSGDAMTGNGRAHEEV